MSIRLAMMILVLAVAGCSSTSLPSGGHGSEVAPMLGVIIDKEQRVIQVFEGSGAQAAGVQVGDILLDLEWIPDPPPELVPTPEVGTPIVMTVPAPIGDVGADVSPLPITDTELPELPEVDIVPGQVITIPAGIPAPAFESVGDYIEKGTVPFTDDERLMDLIPYGVPLKLRVQRGDQVLELTVVPNTSMFLHELPPGATRTPKPEGALTY